MFYLLAYGLSTVGVFALLTLVRDGDGEASHLSQWAGLAQRSPFTAAVMALFLLALAGIPLTSGFTGKFAVFRAAIEDGAWPLVVVAVLASAVAAFFYLRVIVLMYFSPPAEDGPTDGVPGLPTTVVLAVTPPPPWCSVSCPDRCSISRSRRLIRRLMTGARAAVGDSPPDVWRRGATPASTIGPWLPDGPLGESLAEGLARRGRPHGVGRQRAPVRPRGRRPPHVGRWQAVPADADAARRPTGRPDVGQVVRAAVVCELTHLATLYHDDVIDEAAVRRGAPSANSRWTNSVAILTGDLLFARASDLLADWARTPSASRRARSSAW